MKRFLLSLSIVMLAGCTTPCLTNSVKTYYPDGKLHVDAIYENVGLQNLYGERTITQTTPEVSNASSTDNKAAGALIGSVAGLVVGGAVGQPILGAATGGGLGLASQYFGGSSSATPVIPGIPSGIPLSLNPILGALLKQYIIAHPDQCQLVQTIGLAATLALIDQIFAAPVPTPKPTPTPAPTPTPTPVPTPTLELKGE